MAYQNYTVLYVQFYHLEQVALGAYGYQWKDSISAPCNDPIPALHLAIQKYKGGDIDPASKTFDVMSNNTDEGKSQISSNLSCNIPYSPCMHRALLCAEHFGSYQ